MRIPCGSAGRDGGVICVAGLTFWQKPAPRAILGQTAILGTQTVSVLSERLLLVILLCFPLVSPTERRMQHAWPHWRTRACAPPNRNMLGDSRSAHSGTFNRSANLPATNCHMGRACYPRTPNKSRISLSLPTLVNVDRLWNSTCSCQLSS